ncbi:MAG: GGDEF domain-containing protein [Methyloceanibacter sp.]|nr:GGDEF domain-containing protein [Methyloceanibacter sp.]
MPLDMQTMSVVNLTVTAMLGLVLVFTWARERECPFVGWWGLALLIQAVGVVLAATSSILLAFGAAAIILGDALKWKAAQQFAERRASPLWIFLGPVAFLLAAQLGYLQSFNYQLGAVCTILALYDFAAASELARADGDRLASRWPAVALLVVIGLGYLSWLPLNLAMPIHESQWVFASVWFPTVILVTLLLRIALAFIVLSMAKERQELEQRVDALTDLLTGLPNRRALFEAADALGQDKERKRDAVSVLLFDLDHFKETNDRFGHAFGDRVLKLFATTASAKLNGGSIVARLGGEEFAAILPGADPMEAAGVAEAVRRAFAKSAAFVDGLPVGATVSVGAASVAEIDGDLNALFRRADAALYIAKRAGRNRVELLGPEDGSPVAEVEVAVRSSLRKPAAPLAGLLPAKLRA